MGVGVGVGVDVGVGAIVGWLAAGAAATTRCRLGCACEWMGVVEQLSFEEPRDQKQATHRPTFSAECAECASPSPRQYSAPARPRLAPLRLVDTCIHRGPVKMVRGWRGPGTLALSASSLVPAL